MTEVSHICETTTAGVCWKCGLLMSGKTVTTEHDEIKAYLDAIECDLGVCKNTCSSCLTNISTLLDLVRCYREANQFYVKAIVTSPNPLDVGYCDDGKFARRAEKKAKEIIHG